jgi:hypothetical protein
MHLTAREFVDALEAALAPSRQRHLDGCERCRARLDDMEALTADARASVGVPEPSPLFWQHLGERVREAAQDRGVRRGWSVRSVGVLAGLAAAVLMLVLGTAPGAPEPATEPIAASAADPAAITGDDALAAITRLEAAASYEALREAAAPGGDATDALFAQLTAEERAELARLLRAEIGSTQ